MRELRPGDLTARARYELLTSLVVPRPIGWIGSWGPDGTANLAPFSYFAALSSSPLQVGVSVGHRRDSDGGRVPKDTLRNVREQGAFAVHVVTEPFLEAMNATSAELSATESEFAGAGLEVVPARVIDAPTVAGAPVVLECRVRQEVPLGEAPNTLVIGEVVHLRVSEELGFAPGTHRVDPEALRPVARLGGADYALLGRVRTLPRP